MLVLPDHPTPLCLRTHTRDAVPYIIYDSTKDVSGVKTYTEETAKESGIVINEGYKLITRFIN